MAAGCSAPGAAPTSLNIDPKSHLLASPPPPPSSRQGELVARAPPVRDSLTNEESTASGAVPLEKKSKLQSDEHGRERKQESSNCACVRARCLRFTGSVWASVLQGWGNLACMYCFNSISREFFFATTFGLLLWLGLTFWRDTGAYGNSSPMTSLKELIFGK